MLKLLKCWHVFSQSRGPTPLTYLKPVAEADKAGYTMEEIIMGLNNCPFLELVNWLRNEYKQIQNRVRMAAESTPYVSVFNDLTFHKLLFLF